MSDLFTKSAIEDARKDVMRKRDDGCVCPVCDQFVKVYKRLLNSTMARQLIVAWNKNGDRWFHTRDVVLEGSAGAGDFAKLENWGLISPRDHEKGDQGKRTSGLWCITQKGAGFIHGHVQVPSHALIYNNELLGFTQDMVTIQDCLGKHFDYNELMGRQ